MDPDLDLVVERVIRAPRDVVWRAWTDPERLATWWLPAPMVGRVLRLDVRSGGAFVTEMSDGGAFVPHLDACFVEVVEGETIVFTTALDSTLRPAEPQPLRITARVTFADHADGTDYRIVVRHADAATRDHHLALGFRDGWEGVADQLAALVEP